MMRPKYDIVVQNWTSIARTYGNMSYSTLTSAYTGEIIPPYAVLRVIAPARLYKSRLVFPVALPDDNSDLWQQAGLHFFNGPNAIPIATFQNQPPTNHLPADGGYGLATQEFPAPVLTDIGNNEPTITPYDPWDSVGTPFRIHTGKWALGLTDIGTQDAPYVSLSAFGWADKNVPTGMQYTYKVQWVSCYNRQPA